MPVNPYEYDPKDDEDLFGDEDESTHENEFTDSDDPYLSILNEIISRENLSPQEAKQLRELIAKITPTESSMSLSGFLTFDSQAQRNRSNASMYRAMMHVLDEMTDGRVIKLWRVFDLESQAIITKATLDITNNVHAKNLEKGSSEEKMKTIALIFDVLNYRLDKLHQQYNMAVEQVENYEPDYNIFERGKKSPETPSWVNRILFWRKPNKN